MDVSWLSHACREVARMLVPVACPGCGREDVRVCDECAAAWWEPAWRAEQDAARLDLHGRVGFPVWVASSLAAGPHGMVSAWKDGGRRDLDSFFAEAAGRIGEQIAPTLAGLPGPICVVAVPSRPASTRRRGVDLPESLGRAVAAGLSARGTAADSHRALAIGAGEQRHSSAIGRWRAMRSAVRVRSPPPRGCPVLLVDDVVTTGATIAACAAALERSGSAVIGAVALAAVERVASGGETGIR